MVLIFVHHPLLSCSRAIHCLLEDGEINYTVTKVDLFDEKVKATLHYLMVDDRVVPLFEDGEFKLSEPIAILKYLCRTKAVAKHWYPEDNIRK
mmetsp:Transcript_18261/g.8495  ORF Transcript_18261/g.8495 Transcript_18261/m.8495 type:complete len:93 (+) Transcript_18261:13-291(+)